MKVLVLGGGGREHAVCWKLHQSPKLSKLYVAPGNAATALIAENIPLNPVNGQQVTEFCIQNKIDLCIVTPDDPLAAGVVDSLLESGINAFGPIKQAAQLESSKIFSKQLMKKYGIPTADFSIFYNKEQAIASLNQFPIVIKCDGLALGKGVYIAQNYDEAVCAINEIMDDRKFGSSGDRIIIEQFLEGEEITVLAFTDGNTILPMESSKDHKRAYEHDKGPNTGGMGALSPSPIYTETLHNECMVNIYEKTIHALKSEGIDYKGVIYFGLMNTKNGVYVIEYNARFGDPEAQVLLPRLKNDILDIFIAVTEGRLHEIQLEWKQQAAACVVLASGGYPGKYEVGKEIFLAPTEDSPIKDTIVFHAGTKLVDGHLLTAGGRVLCVTALGENLFQAVDNAYNAIKPIHFEEMHYRKDIGYGQKL